MIDLTKLDDALRYKERRGDIILEKLCQTVTKTENLLTTLKDLITPDLS